jgi:hypothetical protein
MNEPMDTGMTPRDARNTKRYILFQAIWAVAFGVSTFLLAAKYVELLPLRWLLALIPSVFAAMAARAYWRYLTEMDELLQVIELKALALAIAAGFITWPAVFLLEVGVLLDLHVPVVLLVMTGFYVFGLARGRMAYLL